jgi:hypothetical protein
MDDDGYGKPGPMWLDDDAQWLSLMGGHLRGDTGIGVYPLYNERVHWGCVDLDDGTASLRQAVNLYDVLRAMQVPAFIERSKSKGHHVWVLCDEWVPAQVMRNALLGACQTAGTPDREVNPKQIRLAEGQIGNFVRLPFKGGFANPERQVVVDLLDVPLTLELFLSLAETHRATRSALIRAARDLYAPPPPVRKHVAPHTNAGPWKQRLSPLAKEQYHHGPRVGTDRSSYLFALGKSCAESGLDEEEIIDALTIADERWCDKFTGRPDAEARYRDIARKALVS